MNFSDCLSESEVREKFASFGGVIECDGAVDGPSDGFIMVSVANQDVANAAISGMKKAGSVIGRINFKRKNGMLNSGFKSF